MLTSSVPFYNDENLVQSSSKANQRPGSAVVEKKTLSLSSSSSTTKRKALGEITNTSSARKALGDISNKPNNSNQLSNGPKQPQLKSKIKEDAPKPKKLFQMPQVEEMNSFYFSAMPNLPTALRAMNPNDLLTPMSFIPCVSEKDQQRVSLPPPMFVENDPLPDGLFTYGDREVEVRCPDYDHLTENLLVQ